MSDVVISARGLGKRYLIGHETVDRSQTFRERIMAGAGGLARNIAKTARGQQLVQGEVEEFWALKDIDFDIRRGDTVGIIGRNGAGKSTLLKILSRITEPTTGRVDLRGRVASLLEVGTGFHPELTGRENIFLNGAILGMGRTEIRRKLDEITSFAGIEKFLDTPVKRYSSGMGVRLGFSVAAHLEPEILIVDEVLAVGDAEFQKKCLGKMSEVAGEGRTVLFVSHNLSAIGNLCRTGIYLQNGQVEFTGPVDEATSRYISPQTSSDGAFPSSGRSDDYRISKIETLDPFSKRPVQAQTWRPLLFRLHFQSPVDEPNGAIEFRISTKEGTCIFRTSTRPDTGFAAPFRLGANYADIEVPKLFLSEGTYVMGGALTIPNLQWLFREDHGPELHVVAKAEGPYTQPPTVERNGIAMEHKWALMRDVDVL